MRTLVLQVTTQLQALSTLSPSTLRQIQLQILGLGQTTQATAVPPSTGQTSLVALPLLQEPAIVAPQLQAQGPTNASLTNPGASLLANLQASIAVQQRPAYTGVANVNLNSTTASPALPQTNAQPPPSQQSCMPPAQPQVAQPPDASNLLEQLRKKHAEALESARQTAVEHQIQPSTASLASEASRHIAKKQRVTTNASANNSGVVFLPLEQATAVSTGSNSTSQSSEFQAGDEGQGQASLSEYDEYDDDDDGVDYSLPLRKRRFQDANGPITQQNLAAHDRMQQQQQPQQFQMNTL